LERKQIFKLTINKTKLAMAIHQLILTEEEYNDYINSEELVQNLIEQAESKLMTFYLPHSSRAHIQINSTTKEGSEEFFSYLNENIDSFTEVGGSLDDMIRNNKLCVIKSGGLARFRKGFDAYQDLGERFLNCNWFKRKVITLLLGKSILNFKR
jgi:hypothetical protein